MATAEPATEAKTGDRPFAPGKVAKCALPESIVARVLHELQDYEARHQLRQRKRRPADQRKFVKTVSALLHDVMQRHAALPGGRLSLSLSNDKLGGSSRYKADAINTTLPDIAERLASDELAFLVVVKGKRRTGLTTVAAGPKLIEAMKARGVTASDIGGSGAAEVIELRDRKEHAKAKPKRLSYQDTEDTRRWRAQMQDINAWIASADLAFAGLDQKGRLVDTSKRGLTRVFWNGRFDHGGRLYSGFWQDISKERRLQALTIEGEPIAELDFSQCGPRILYGHAKEPPPADCYSVPGHEAQREGFKKLLSALLIAGVDSLRRYPQGTRELFPGGMKVDEAKALLLAHNAGIAGLIEPDTGHRLSFRESEILIDVLLSLKALGIVALPIHDAVLVKQSQRDAAEKVMREVFHRHTGQEGVVR